MTTPFKFPDLGEGIAEGELINWLVKEGDQVQEDQDLLEVETDKALVTIPSPQSGVVEKLMFKAGDRIPVGETLLYFKEGEESPAKEKVKEESKGEPKTEKAKEEAEQVTPESPSTQKKLPPRASPHVRKIAREKGLDLEKIKGTGQHGRITEKDIKNYQSTPTPTTQPSPAPVLETQEDFSAYGPVEEEALKSIRRKISENMLQAMQHTAMVTHMDEAIVNELMKLRKEKAEYAKEKGVKLTLLPFLMKASALGLKKYPALNASLMGETIFYKKYYHFGFAVDTEAGLMVPVIKNVDQKSILTLAKELTDLSEKARTRKIAAQDFKGSSFSLTNIGSIGGRAFTPILNYPDSAILGIGRVYQKPIVDPQGSIRPASILPLCLTFDHRITDGATAAKFTNLVIQYLQDPDLLLLDEGK